MLLLLVRAEIDKCINRRVSYFLMFAPGTGINHSHIVLPLLRSTV